MRKLLLHEGTTQIVADVHWLDGPSSRVPIADLRRVTAETPSQPVRVKPGRVAVARDPWRARRIKYGSLDGLPVRWRGWEAWEMWCDGKWHETNAAEVVTKAWVMTEQEYLRSFSYVPPLPIIAFGGDATNGWTSPLV